MLEWWDNPVVQLVFWGTVLAVMIALGFFLVRKLRDSSRGDQQGHLDHLSNFQEMREQGDISDKEYRTINALLQASSSGSSVESRSKS